MHNTCMEKVQRDRQTDRLNFRFVGVCDTLIFPYLQSTLRKQIMQMSDSILVRNQPHKYLMSQSIQVPCNRGLDSNRVNTCLASDHWIPGNQLMVVRSGSPWNKTLIIQCCLPLTFSGDSDWDAVQSKASAYPFEV